MRPGWVSPGLKGTTLTSPWTLRCHSRPASDWCRTKGPTCLCSMESFLSRLPVYLWAPLIQPERGEINLSHSDLLPLQPTRAHQLTRTLSLVRLEYMKTAFALYFALVLSQDFEMGYNGAQSSKESILYYIIKYLLKDQIFVGGGGWKLIDCYS